jgi:DNA-binding Xre family transcriptional regulator
MSVAELAHRSAIGVATIKRLEASDGVPSANLKTVNALLQALESEGIEFIGSPEDAPGVRLKKVKG